MQGGENAGRQAQVFKRHNFSLPHRTAQMHGRRAALISPGTRQRLMEASCRPNQPCA
ncbi:hypothetical protein D557_0483 [Bordetella holmesii 70147]|nr:hypothetical protein D558_1226 [Bordetella holmesii 44057]EWM50638.1 hypothetical protein D557_0483 [Bordetella holmesii 70147]